MYVSFDPFLLLFWVFITSFIPGAIFALGLFNKTNLRFFEKVLIGFGIGFAAPAFIFFMLAIIGISYSFTIALLCVGIFYALSIGLFLREKVSIDFKKLLNFENKAELIIPVLIILLLFVTYFVRMQSYSPVFQELDPYYYAFSASQLITIGSNPVNDQTAWYPVLEVDHKRFSFIGDLEAIWYSFYTGGGTYDKYIMSLVSGQYPPIAAALAVFFVYLLVSVAYKREWGLIAAAIFSFLPMFLIKTSAGEMESQPFAFFAISFFLAAYLFAFRQKDLKFFALAGFAYGIVTLGSASEVLIFSSLFLFIIFHSLVLAFTKDEKYLKEFVMQNLVVVLIGPIFIKAVLLDGLWLNAFNATNGLLFVFALAFAYCLSLVKTRIKDVEVLFYVFCGAIVIGLILFAFTPMGQLLKDAVLRGIATGQFNDPLQRTIAEQGNAGSNFSGEIGFIAFSPDGVAAAFVKDSSSIFFGLIKSLADVIYLPFAYVINASFSLITSLINTAFGTNLSYTEKIPSMMMFILFLFIVFFIISFIKLTKGDDNFSIFFVSLILLPTIIGLLKTKYSIYSGYLVAIAFGFVLGEAFDFFSKYIKKPENRSYLYYGFAVFASIIVIGQFSASWAPAILQGSSLVRFQDNPLAAQPKFQQICSDLRQLGADDQMICAVGTDPVALANSDINIQYNSVLCYLSLSSNPIDLLRYGFDSNKIPSDDLVLFRQRCSVLAPYWISSMEWISKNTPAGSRVMSWWDYGHWINYFGNRNAVIRNEHLSPEMIGEVAHVYVDGSTDELRKLMKEYGSQYALFDSELVLSGPSNFGGKYGALNYLSCARDNETNVSISPGNSMCEVEHLWETIYFPQNPNENDMCVISARDQKFGMVAYKLVYGLQKDQMVISNIVPAYCIGDAVLATSETVSATYYLDRTDDTGDLVLNKAVILPPRGTSNAINYDKNIVLIPSHTRDDPIAVSDLVYTYDQIWLENGEVKSGYEDRKGKFYDSNLYKAYFLGELEGFSQVYTNSDVKMYMSDN
ncbi:MAG: hypothetical protein ABII22_07240 [Candidatus Micrarchaeota archaeon]